MSRRPKKRLVNEKGELLEAGFQNQVIKLARLGGWGIFHAPHGGDRDRFAFGQIPEGKGFPDLVLARPPELLFRELKTDKGRMGAGQPEWLAALEACGADVGVWRPRDIDEITERLLRPRITPTTKAVA